MPRDWKGPYQRRLKVLATERARHRANVRWRRDCERREKLAVLTAEQHPTKIAARIVVIIDEKEVKEFTLWSFESWRERQRKCRKAEQFVLNGNFNTSIPGNG